MTFPNSTAAAEEFFRRYNSRDPEAMADALSDDATIDYPPLGEPMSLEDGKGVWAQLMDVFPDLSEDVHEIDETADGKAAFVHVTISGTQAKDGFGIDNQGKRYELRHLFKFDLADGGTVDRVTAYFDAAGWFLQLGKTDISDQV
ncbi:ester cyclase [Erythrobacter rubeus]|uniref:Nuclear transport factor 2 family protein n=1 Tax=Erythrobacter rubeus TaxID=2760803 RepID=A0ABR8KTF2_9SPHN|nr:nuclear transport factor 2 family protein [Erythrobacter rubeus]MBD2842630.1 nuclear transport factor 2 family protein [Erythrobacter rubeus]